jgi:ADP-ribose pyrophosphatase YjhB (NUDIX family)
MKVIKTINIIVLDSQKKKILLLKRSSDDILLRKWSCPGQAQKKDETDLEAAQRIIKEDLSIDVKEFKLFTKNESTTKNSVVKSKYFVTIIKDEIKLNDQRYTQFQWNDLNEELFFIDYSFNQKDIIADFLKSRK